MKTLLATVTVLVVFGCLSGCFEDDAVWTPDSSGVVYLRGDGALAHYDIASRETRVLAQLDYEHRGELLEKPAISPRGDRVAIVRYLLNGKDQSVQVVIYDLHGKEVHRSSTFRLPENPVLHEKPVTWLGRAHWSPDGRRILCTVYDDTEVNKIHAEKPQPTDYDSLCLYDLSTEKLLVYHNLIELEDTVIFGISPFSPDNRGFIAESTNKPVTPTGVENIVFVDWSGRQHHFTASSAILQADRQLAEQDEADARTPGGHTAADNTPGHWKQSRLIMPFFRGRLVVDTASRMIDYESDAAATQIAQYSKSHGVTVTTLQPGVLIQERKIGDGNETRSCIELRIRGKAGRPWSTVNVRTVDNILGIAISPDQRHALIHYEDAKKHGRLIINAAGKVVGDLR